MASALTASDRRRALARAMVEAHFTFAEVAGHFGVAPSTVHRWLRGDAKGRARRKAEAVARLYARRQAEGLCRCGGTPVPGLTRCADCGEAAAARRQRLRDAAMAAYGGACACCGETTPEFLTIDHIERDGAEHRREVGSTIYSWLASNRYPAGFQVLCFNCNCGRERNGGVCPHEAERGQVVELRAAS